jgi:hypothetical protein
MASINDFGVDTWATCRSWQSAKTILEKQWQDTLHEFEGVFGNQSDLRELREEGRGYIMEIEEDVRVLTFDNQKGVLSGNAEINFIEQRQKEKTEIKEQKSEREKELEEIYKVLRMPKNAQARIPTEVRPLNGLAWEVTKDWENAQPLGKRIRNEDYQGWSGKQRERFDAIKSIIPDKFDSQFFITENFCETTTTSTSIFSNYQKTAKYLLISWGQDSKLPKCHFLARSDMPSVRGAIEAGTLQNCYLCTADGVSDANHNNPPKSKEEEIFLEQAQWIAHFSKPTSNG